MNTVTYKILLSPHCLTSHCTDYVKRLLLTLMCEWTWQFLMLIGSCIGVLLFSIVFWELECNYSMCTYWYNRHGTSSPWSFIHWSHWSFPLFMAGRVVHCKNVKSICTLNGLYVCSERVSYLLLLQVRCDWNFVMDRLLLYLHTGRVHCASVIWYLSQSELYLFQWRPDDVCGGQTTLDCFFLSRKISKSKNFKFKVWNGILQRKSGWNLWLQLRNIPKLLNPN